MIAFSALLLGLLLAAAAYAGAFVVGSAPEWSGWAMAGALVLTLPATLAIGGRPRGGGGMVVGVAWLLAVVLAAGFALAFGLPAEDATTALWGGLPPRAAVIVYGIGLLPLLFLPWAYARDCARRDLDAETVTALAEECARIQRDRGIVRVDAG